MRKIHSFTISVFLMLGFAHRAFSEMPKIGVSLPTQSEEHWVRDKKSMEETAKALGVDLKVQITNNDSARQISQVENLVSQGIKVLIIAPHDAYGAAVVVAKAKKAGVKVIAYDRMIMGCEPDLYVSVDNEKVGELQGEYLIKSVPKGNYVILSGSPTDNNSRLYKQGAMKHIQPLVDKGDVKIVMDQAVKDWQPAEAQRLIEQALTANKNKIDAVLAPNDGTAGGAIQAIASQGLAGKVVITGQDAELAAAIRIVKGTQSMTVFKDSRLIAAKAVAMAAKMANNESINADINGKINNHKIDVPAVLFPGIVVDKNNLDQALIKSGFLSQELMPKKI